MAKFGNRTGTTQGQQSQALVPAAPGVITEQRCKVCTSPHRRHIDMMLVTGWSQRAIKNHFNELMGEEYFNDTNISRHKKNHLSVQDAAVRRIIEARARQFGMDVDAAEEHIMTKAGAVDTIIHRGLEAIQSGNVEFKAGEVLQAIQLLDKMEAEWKDSAIDEIMAEFKAFTQAVKEVVGEEMYEEIFNRFEARLNGHSAISPAPEIPPSDVEGEVVSEE